MALLKCMDNLDKKPGSAPKLTPKHAFERTLRTYIYEKVHKYTPFLDLIPLHERAAILTLARTLPAAIQVVSNPFSFNRCPVRALV